MEETSLKTPDAIAPLADALGSVRELAATLARKEGLYDGKGGIHCWKCHRPGATLPTLHCEPCAAVVRQQRVNDAEIARLEHPETKRWRAIFVQMSESDISRESAERFQVNCEKLDSATDERKAELQRRFDARFARRQAPARGWNGRGFKGQSDKSEEWHP
jgi:hypothetical protein